jgi:hypothetical protein
VRRLAVALLLILVVVPLSGRRPLDVPSNQVTYCTVMAEAPTAGPQGKSIRGAAWFECERPGPDALTLTVAVQRGDANGQWHTVASGQFAAQGAQTTRDRPRAERTRAVTAPCAAGTYRTSVSSVTTLGGRRRPYDIGSPRVKDPCRAPR